MTPSYNKKTQKLSVSNMRSTILVDKSYKDDPDYGLLTETRTFDFEEYNGMWEDAHCSIVNEKDCKVHSSHFKRRSIIYFKRPSTSRICLRYLIPQGIFSSTNYSLATEQSSPTCSDADELIQSQNIVTPTMAQPDGNILPYSLVSTIGNGSEQMIVLNNSESKPLRPNDCHLDVSYFADKNGRGFMEDRFLIQSLGALRREQHLQILHDCLCNDEKMNSPSASFFAVFDGFGGEEASQFSCDWISSYIKYYLTLSDSIGTAIKSAFQSLDKDFLSTEHTSGSTICSCILIGRELVVCANAGDSRAIVIQNDGTVVNLSRNHRAGAPNETKRIIELGGKVIYSNGWTLEGKLAVSRGIGNVQLKPYMTCDPEITEYQLDSCDQFLVLGTCSIFDVIDNRQLAKMVQTYCARKECESTNPFQLSAQIICGYARDLGSSDNLSLIVVDLRS